jgi:hypothetical protein
VNPSWQNPKNRTCKQETRSEKAAKTRIGKYLTQVETNFINKTIDLSQTNVIIDVSADAGKFSRISQTSNAATISLDIDSYGLKRLKLKTTNIDAIQTDAEKSPLKTKPSTPYLCSKP